MARIAIFDSGVGGLSIYTEVQALLPQHEYLFVSDNRFFPYGNKAADEVLARVTTVVDELVKQYRSNVLVIACNTASTIVLPALRQRHAIPIVGVVPAIKPAAQQSKNKHIAVLATPATISRDYTRKLIEEFAADCKVIKLGSSKLVELAEDKLYGLDVDTSVLEAELSPILEHAQCDTLVLACTHFPLLNREINTVFDLNNHTIRLVDSANAIANRVKSIINTEKFQESTQPTNNQARFTRSIAKDYAFIKGLSKIGLEVAGTIEC